MVAIRTSRGGAGIFFVGGSYDLNDSGTTLRRFAIEAGQPFDTGGALARLVPFPNTVTLSRWTIRIIANAKTGDVTFNFLNNAIASNSNIVIPFGVTGVFQDLVNVDVVITPNDTEGQMDSTGSGAFLINPVSLIFRAVV